MNRKHEFYGEAEWPVYSHGWFFGSKDNLVQLHEKQLRDLGL